MELQFSERAVLIDLGLTLVQAKLYLTLVKSNPLKIAAISKASKVARPEIYRNLSKLQQLGLVEKIIKTPLTYRAIPMDKGLALLLETKTSQCKKVTAETQLLLNRAKMKKQNKQIETPQFVLIPKGKSVIDRINTAIERVQLSIDLVLSWKRFSVGMVSTFAESMENAWARAIKVRLILEQPSVNKTVKQLIQSCKEKCCVQIRFIPNCPDTVFGIYDNKEIFIIVFSKKDLLGSPALWSTNRSLIALAQDHFEILWLTAKESLY